MLGSRQEPIPHGSFLPTHPAPKSLLSTVRGHRNVDSCLLDSLYYLFNHPKDTTKGWVRILARDVQSSVAVIDVVQRGGRDD